MLQALLTKMLSDKSPEESREILLENLYLAAKRGNASAVAWLLDNPVHSIKLTDTEKAELVSMAAISSSIPLMEVLTDEKRGTNRITLDEGVLEIVIKQFPRHSDRYLSQDNLPSLFHWLTDAKHGNIAVNDTHIDLIKETDCADEFLFAKGVIFAMATKAKSPSPEPK